MLVTTLTMPVVHAEAQSLVQLRDVLEDLVEVPAVSGHEGPLAGFIADRLRESGFEVDIDRMSNVTVTIGSGSPHRLLVANIDERGCVVSGWTDDGYLRMARIGLSPSHHSHSPVEVLAKNDLEALAEIIRYLVVEF